VIFGIAVIAAFSESGYAVVALILGVIVSANF
jgi:hypothetical protein